MAYGVKLVVDVSVSLANDKSAVHAPAVVLPSPQEDVAKVLQYLAMSNWKLCDRIEEQMEWATWFLLRKGKANTAFSEQLEVADYLKALRRELGEQMGILATRLVTIPSDQELDDCCLRGRSRRHKGACGSTENQDDEGGKVW